ncbi:hypothetical protein Tco_1440650 [Tanacetum coccineum]
MDFFRLARREGKKAVSDDDHHSDTDKEKSPSQKIEKKTSISGSDGLRASIRTGPKWLFDIDSLTQSMNYVPVSAGTVSNVSAGTSEENSQDCIVMPIWKDSSYFDSPTKMFVDDSRSKMLMFVWHKLSTCHSDVNTIKPTSIAKALSVSSWVEAMQKELLQFKLQQVWILVDLLNGNKAIGTKWVFRNKKDEKGIMLGIKQV